MAEEVKITALDNGPYLVRGPVTITDAEGNQFHTDRETVARCRRGGSTNKPFCDGTHSKVRFQAPNRAVQEAEEQG